MTYLPILSIVAFQILLTFILLKISGEIGKLTVPMGYASLSRATRSKNLPFNVLYRILFVPVALSIVAIFFYLTELDYFLNNIWLVAIWYSLLQFLYSINRLRYIDIKIYLFGVLTSIGLSYYFYQFGISKGLDYILPDAGNFRTELWFIIFIFFYNLLNIFEQKDDSDDFGDKLTEQYLLLKNKYRRFIRNEFLTNKFLNDLLFTIMIYEDTNRPSWLRFLEKIFFRFGFIKTTGIMQIESDVFLTDEKSIERAQEIIFKEYNNNSTLREGYQRFELVGKIATVYNPDAYYREEIRSLFNRVEFVSKFLESHWSPSQETLQEEESLEDEISRLRKEIEEMNSDDLPFEIKTIDKQYSINV